MNKNITTPIALGIFSSCLSIIFYLVLRMFPETYIFGIFRYELHVNILIILTLTLPITILVGLIDMWGSGLKNLKFYFLLYLSNLIFFIILYLILNQINHFVFTI